MRSIDLTSSDSIKYCIEKLMKHDIEEYQKHFEDFDPEEYRFSINQGVASSEDWTPDGYNMEHISDLISIMWSTCASYAEMADAIKYSMVLIDGKKKNLNVKKAYEDFHIAQLIKRYGMEPMYISKENEKIFMLGKEGELIAAEVPVSKKNDPINHPAHYTNGKIEVIDYIEDKKLGFNLGNAVKYISRAGRKDPDKEIEDLEKAVWYVNRQIKLLKKQKVLDIPKHPVDGYCYGNRKDE